MGKPHYYQKVINSQPPLKFGQPPGLHLNVMHPFIAVMLHRQHVGAGGDGGQGCFQLMAGVGDIRLPLKEQWGVLVRADSQLAEKEFVTPEDLRGVPLLMVRRELVKNELANWFGDSFDQLEIAATYNLIVNAAFMVEQGLGVALCFDLGAVFENLRFVPLTPRMETGSVLVWKKNQTLSAANALFIQHIRNTI